MDGPIQRNSFSNVRHETDVIPFASSSDEEDDVVVGQTLVEINTPSMHFDAEFSSTTIRRQFLVKSKEEIHHTTSVDDGEELGSSDEISEEEENEEDVEAEFQKIQAMEERYILQNSAKTPKLINTDRSEANKENDEERFNNESDEEDEEDESDIEDEEIDEERVTLMPDDENKIDEHDVNNEPLTENKMEIPTATGPVPNEQSPIPCNPNSRVDHKGNSYTNLKSIAEQKSEQDAQRTNEMLQLPLLDDNLAKLTDTSIELNAKKIASEVIDALKTTLSNTNTHRDDQKIEKTLSKMSINQEDKTAAMPDSTDAKEQEIEHENEQNNGNNACSDHCDESETYYDDQFDYHITSKTPTSFNSDDYIFHANFIKQCQRMNSTDRLMPKPQPRKSMSFSNERMREIERHNQILLRKILTQKPTYNLKGKPSQSSLQKTASQANARLTTSAVNRKKQQRQIDMDNQILKKKLDAIAVRRRPLMS